jgi:hypothetical protein
MVVPRGPIYRVVRGSIYIVQIAPNCPVNRAEYRGTRSLQLFTIYNYFHANQPYINMCPCLVVPSASGL